MRRSFILAAVLAGAALVPQPVQAKTVTIETKEFKFVPPTGDLAVGDTVVFRNTGAAPHNAVASDGSFKTAIINSGSEESVQITKAGSIPYVCTLHETVGMKATLTVAAAGGPPNDGAPPPGTNPGGSDPGGVQVPPTPTAPPTPAESEAGGATDPSPSPTAGAEEESEELAAERPPTQKYFPFLALLMLLALGPMVGMSYRRLVKAGPRGPEPPEPPAAEA